MKKEQKVIKMKMILIYNKHKKFFNIKYNKIFKFNYFQVNILKIKKIQNLFLMKQYKFIQFLMIYIIYKNLKIILVKMILLMKNQMI